MCVYIYSSIMLYMYIIFIYTDGFSIVMFDYRRVGKRLLFKQRYVCMHISFTILL